jgi:hypothetical protein
MAADAFVGYIAQGLNVAPIDDQTCTPFRAWMDRFDSGNFSVGNCDTDRVLPDGAPVDVPCFMFQHEGGSARISVHMRQRAAAQDLVRFPGIPAMDIAYSVGFRSASDFTRAFRRAYGIAPQEMRPSAWRRRRICALWSDRSRMPCMPTTSAARSRYA